MKNISLPQDIAKIVKQALLEDVAQGDITAHLIPEDNHAMAQVVLRESAVLCGVSWFNEVFHQLDETIKIQWHYKDGDLVAANNPICLLEGKARALLTGERSALNFLQTLSATATKTRHYVNLIKGTTSKILDTRKTIPGLRLAQKYAVLCGRGHNHRLGLYDGILIKENHIIAAGGIHQAVHQARQLTRQLKVEVEVENIQEMQQALAAQADWIMLDNFSIKEMKVAVQLNNQQAVLEASGGINEKNIVQVAQEGVDYISIGDLTKNIQAIDLSMRFDL